MTKRTLVRKSSGNVFADLGVPGASEALAKAEIARRIVEILDVAINRFRRWRGKVLPFAEAEGLLRDEDVFKALS